MQHGLCVRYSAAMPPAAKAKAKAKKRSPSLAQRQRAKKNKCGAETRDGGICTKPAGWGTDHLGSGKCKHHGGSTRNGKAHATRDEVNGMAKPLTVTPGQGITGVMQLAAGQLAYISQKVAELTDGELFEELEGPEGGVTAVLPNRWVRLQQALMRDLAKYSRAAADMGIAERQQALAEAQTKMFQMVLEAVLDDLNLTGKQRKLVGPAIRKQLPRFIDSRPVEDGVPV